MSGSPSVKMQQQAWQARPRALSVGVRETCDGIDAAEHDILEAREDAESCRKSVPLGTALIAGGAAITVGCVGAIVLGGVSGPAVPFALIGGLIGAMGGMARFSAVTGMRTAKAKEQAGTDDLARLGQELQDRCKQERAANERSLLKTGGSSGMATLQHVEADPYLGVAAHRFKQSRALVSRSKALLQASRAERFAAYPVRMREIWSERVELMGSLVMCGLLASSVGVGFAVARFLPGGVGAVAGLATAVLEAVAWNRHGAKVIAPPVDKALKKEIEADIVREEPRLDERRKRFETLREDTLQHYVSLLAQAPAQSPAQPPEVVRGDGQVIVGGVAVPKKAEIRGRGL